MNTLLITYDIQNTGDCGSCYNSLYEAIKSYGTWAHITESCWAIKTNSSATTVRDRLLSLLRENDRLMVVQTAHIAAWGNVMCTNDWLRENI